MISYATCVYRPDVYRTVCRPALLRQRDKYGAQILTATDSRSIFAAYERMRKKARIGNTVVYLHDDLELMDADATPRIIDLMDRSGAGILGVVGSVADALRVPWWEAKNEGTWCQRSPSRPEVLRYQNGKKLLPPGRFGKPFVEAENLDGILIADRTNLPWSKMDGWHGYDVDRCQQAKAAGHTVVVGDVLVCHHNQPHVPEWLPAHGPRMEEMREKWGLL